MARVRLSTTVDVDLLAAARAVNVGSDTSLIEAALTSLVAAQPSAAIDAAYANAYAAHPFDEPDASGDWPTPIT